MTYGDYYELWNEYYGEEDSYGVDLSVAMQDFLEIQDKASELEDTLSYNGLMSSLTLDSFD
jgi:hypothetical protein